MFHRGTPRRLATPTETIAALDFAVCSCNTLPRAASRGDRLSIETQPRYPSILWVSVGVRSGLPPSPTPASRWLCFAPGGNPLGAALVCAEK